MFADKFLQHHKVGRGGGGPASLPHVCVVRSAAAAVEKRPCLGSVCGAGDAASAGACMSAAGRAGRAGGGRCAARRAGRRTVQSCVCAAQLQLRVAHGVGCVSRPCPQDFPRIATFLPGRTVEEVVRLCYAIQVLLGPFTSRPRGRAAAPTRPSGCSASAPLPARHPQPQLQLPASIDTSIRHTCVLPACSAPTSSPKPGANTCCASGASRRRATSRAAGWEGSWAWAAWRQTWTRRRCAVCGCVCGVGCGGGGGGAAL